MEAVKTGRAVRFLLIFAAVCAIACGVLVFSACDFLYQLGPAGFLEQLSGYGVNPALDGYKQLDADLAYMASYNGKLYVFGNDGIYEIDEASFDVTAAYPVPDVVDFDSMDYRQTRGRWYVGYDTAAGLFLMNTVYMNSTLENAPLIIAGLPGTLAYTQFFSGQYYGNIGNSYDFVYDPALQMDLFQTSDGATSYNRIFPFEFLNFQWSEDDSILYLMMIEWAPDAPILRIAQVPEFDFAAGIYEYPYGYEEFTIKLPKNIGGGEGMWARTDGEKHAAVFFDGSIHVYTMDGKLLYTEGLWSEGTAALSSGGEFLFVMKEDHSGDSNRVKISKYRLVP